MFAYEKDGKLCIMMSGNKPAAEGVTPDVVIEPVTVGEVIKAKVSINGKEISGGSGSTAEEDIG